MACGGTERACGVKAQLTTVEERLVVKIVGKLAVAGFQLLNDRLRSWMQL
jgi:hypothetical protein